MSVKDGDLDGWKRATLKLCQEVCKSLLPGPVHRPAKQADPLPAPDGAADDDIRILPIQIAAVDNQRHRRLEDAQPLFIEDDFEDWPLDGDRMMMHAAREL